MKFFMLMNLKMPTLSAEKTSSSAELRMKTVLQPRVRMWLSDEIIFSGFLKGKTNLKGKNNHIAEFYRTDCNI